MTVNSKILIVEDEIIVAIDLQQRLENMNYNVVGIAGNGDEAIRKTEEFKPDIILMDIMLKGDLDGIKTAQIIHDLHNSSVIYLSGSHDKNVLERAKTTEPHGYINKPFDDTGIQNAIQIAINNTKMSQNILKS